MQTEGLLNERTERWSVGQAAITTIVEQQDFPPSCFFPRRQPAKSRSTRGWLPATPRQTAPSACGSRRS
jgi:hypothetical protein